MPAPISHPGAVVVGLCAHGLGIARSLHGAGARVLALEANPALPGVRTRCAEVRIVPDINGEGLIETLVKLADTADNAAKPVLLLTNDRMVDVVGRHADTIARHYRLSWAHAAAALVPLLGKDRIEARCRETGLSYPKSMLLTDFADAPRRLATLEFPVIAKPTRPVSAFKTQVAQSVETFLAARPRMEQSMPLLVQEFIPGDDRVIRFGALYLDRGRVLARFEGRKLRSRPMGHTTIAVPEPDDAIHALAVRFFEGLALSGPVSLELKQDPDGRFWVIEPTVGRSDFWAGLCAANGVDLALIEYRAQTGQALPAASQRCTHLWINGERDPGALAWLLRHAPAQLVGHWPRGVYFDLRDPQPWLLALRRFVGAMPLRAMRKAGRVVTGKA
jgi:predicted ATP-grasp superfamily ATP-dependent carboligase